MATVNATTLAAAGSLLAIADLINLIKDPEYAQRIPELVDAHETILKAEDFRKEQAAFDASVAQLDSDVADAALRADELAALETALADREAKVALKEAAVATAESAIATRQEELANAEARLKASVAAYVAKGNQLENELSKARAATAEANSVKDEYKAKLTTLSNL